MGVWDSQVLSLGIFAGKDHWVTSMGGLVVRTPGKTFEDQDP